MAHHAIASIMITDTFAHVSSFIQKVLAIKTTAVDTKRRNIQLQSIHLLEKSKMEEDTGKNAIDLSQAKKILIIIFVVICDFRYPQDKCIKSVLFCL